MPASPIFPAWVRVFILGLSLAQVAQAISAPAATTTLLSTTPATTVAAGSALTLQASVTGAGSPVTQGSVTFCDGPHLLVTVQVVSSGTTYPLGTANSKLLLGAGSHSITAVYNGTRTYLASASQASPITVASPTNGLTATAITSRGSAGNYTLQGKVTVVSSLPPTGPVSFLDQSNSAFSLGSATLDPATLTHSWQPFTAWNTANATYAILIGDLNADGIPDLVTSNYSGTSISVLLGNGDGTFQPHADYAVGSFPFGMAMGDLNADGIPDLAIASNNSSTVQILLGNGDGTLQAAQVLATFGTSQYVAMADLNGDGILDLVTCSGGGSSLSVLLGNGDATFHPPQSFGTGSFTDGLAVADFNNDGIPDVAVSNNDGNTLSIFLGNGDGSFAAQNDIIVDSSPTTIAAADLNRDGNLDLVVGNIGGQAVSVLLGNGDGTFQTKVDYPSFSTPWGVSAVDVDGDGIPDLVVAGPSAHALEIFTGNGDGTFQAPFTLSTGVANYVAAVGDLNGDGDLDLAVPSITTGAALVALNSTSVTAALAWVSVPGGGVHHIVAAYAGDPVWASSTSAAISLTGTPFATTLAVNAEPASGPTDQLFVFTATPSPSTSSGYTAEGSITFSQDGMLIGSPVTLSVASAVLSMSGLSAGSHTIAAGYSGDTNFLASNSAATFFVTFPQTITFMAPGPATYGGPPLQLNATASSGLAVTFRVISGPATISGTTLAITGGGNVVMEADQTGNATYTAAPPMQRILAVRRAASRLALTTSAANANVDATVAFTAAVTAPNLPIPTGSAEFLDGTTQLATVAFNDSGLATYTTRLLAPGSHTITATYDGDANFLPSVSSALAENIVPPDYSIAADPNSLTIPRGATGTSTLTLTPTGSFTGQVAFICSGQPQFATCTFVPATAMLSGDNAVRTLKFSLIALPTTASAGLAFLPSMGLLALLFASLIVPMRIVPTRRRKLLLFATAILTLAGCGGSTARQVPLGTSTVTVNAASAGGATQHSANISVTITP